MTDSSAAAAELLARAKDVYSRLASYRDRAECVGVIITGPAPHERRTTPCSFTTLFVRPSHFRFEWVERRLAPEAEWPRYAIWSDGAAVRSWCTIHPTIEEHESLTRPIAAATGVTHGAAHTIARLLMPEIGGRDLVDLRDARAVGEEAIEGRRCARIDGVTHYAGAESLWIDLETGLLLKQSVRREHTREAHEALRANAARAAQSSGMSIPDPLGTYRPFTTESTTTWWPEPGAAIERSVFRFEPPR